METQQGVGWSVWKLIKEPKSKWVRPTIITVAVVTTLIKLWIPTDIRKCAGESNADLRIHYCTDVIERGRLSNMQLADVFFNRGAAFDKKTNYDRAIQDYDEAIRLSANFPNAFHNRGLVYYRRGEYDRARQDYDQAIRLKPTFAVAYTNRGLVYSHKAEFDRAIQDYDAAIRLRPMDAAPFINRGNAYGAKREYDRAMHDYDQVIRIMPTEALAFNNRGAVYIHKEDYDQAIHDYDEAIRLDAKLDEAFYNRGFAYEQKAEYDRAITDYDQAIQLKPTYVAALIGRSIAYQRKGEQDRQNQDYEEAIRLNRTKAGAVFHSRGLIQFDRGEFLSAVSAFEKAAQLSPSDVYHISWLFLAQSRAGQNGRDNLIKNASRLDLKEWPAPIISMYQGKIPPQAVLDAALASDPKKEGERQCEAYFYIAEQLLIQGKQEEAVRMFQAAIHTGVSHFDEYYSAKAELKRIGY